MSRSAIQRPGILLLVLHLLAFAVPRLAPATVYVAMSDDELTAASDVIVIGTDPYAWKGYTEPPQRVFLRPYEASDPLAKPFGKKRK